VLRGMLRQVGTQRIEACIPDTGEAGHVLQRIDSEYVRTRCWQEARSQGAANCCMCKPNQQFQVIDAAKTTSTN
jgi:hypothetical protein